MVGQRYEEESTLLQAVALWLREEMQLHLGDDSPEPGLLHDLAQSNYETCCSALERVGLLASEGHYWRVLKPDDDRPALGDCYKRSELDYLLEGLACHSHYVSDLYQHHKAVTPAGYALQAVCVAMAACGYMKATSERAFEWTADFGPWLVRHGAWDLDEFEPASQKEVNEALASIPADAREQLSGSLCRNKPDFVRCFFAQWIDGKWEEQEWRCAPSDDWDLNLAAGLYAHLHSR